MSGNEASHGCKVFMSIFFSYEYPHMRTHHSDHWFGLLFSQTSPSKKSNLILTIFYPDSEIPWLGLLSYLGPKPTHTDPRVSSASDKDPFPVHPVRSPSFQNPNILLWGSEAVLQVRVCKHSLVPRPPPPPRLNKKTRKRTYQILFAWGEPGNEAM